MKEKRIDETGILISVINSVSRHQGEVTEAIRENTTAIREQNDLLLRASVKHEEMNDKIDTLLDQLDLKNYKNQIVLELIKEDKITTRTIKDRWLQILSAVLLAIIGMLSTYILTTPAEKTKFTMDGKK